MARKRRRPARTRASLLLPVLLPFSVSPWLPLSLFSPPVISSSSHLWLLSALAFVNVALPKANCQSVPPLRIVGSRPYGEQCRFSPLRRANSHVDVESVFNSFTLERLVSHSVTLSLFTAPNDLLLQTRPLYVFDCP